MRAIAPHQNLVGTLGLNETESHLLRGYASGTDDTPQRKLVDALSLESRPETLKALLIIAENLEAPPRTTFPITFAQSEAGKAYVLVDFDKTIYTGDSHNDLVAHGIRTRLKVLLSLPNWFGRLTKMARMAYLYKRHRLPPSTARESVAALLDGLPIRPIAREWAAAPGTRQRIKRRVLNYVHHRARAAVREEWQAIIDEGEMDPMPTAVFEAAVREEAPRRIFIVSSQFADVIRELTAVGEEEDDLLGIPRENILGSSGSFDEDGCFINDDEFVYCMGPVKQEVVDAAMEERGIKINRKTTYVFTDDPFNDAHLLSYARRRSRRVLIDPDSKDSHYART